MSGRATPSPAIASALARVAIALVLVAAAAAPAIAADPVALGHGPDSDIVVRVDTDTASVAVALPTAWTLTLAASLDLPGDAASLYVAHPFDLTGDARSGLTAIVAAGGIASMLQPGGGVGLHAALNAHRHGEALLLQGVVALPVAVGWQQGAQLRYGLRVDGFAGARIGPARIGVVGSIGAVGGGETGAALRFSAGVLVGFGPTPTLVPAPPTAP
ncbi:MAG: hypothetical protein RIT45_1365 [Pseudomonadota bacterium]|jgi:hypothetical protein